MSTMAKTFDSIDPALRGFIQAQKLFFVATSPLSEDGHINLSPKGLDGTFAVLDEQTVAYLDFTGSGVETIAHLRENGRACLMFCAFEGDPLTLRLYGRARAIDEHQDAWAELIGLFPDSAGARQIIDMQVESLLTSCGFGVPLFDYTGEREQLRQWIEKKGPEGIRRYQREKNRLSIDGKPTGTGSGDDEAQ